MDFAPSFLSFESLSPSFSRIVTPLELLLRFCFKYLRFWVPNGRSFAVETRLGSAPEANLESKGRLDSNLDRSGLQLGVCWKDFFGINSSGGDDFVHPSHGFS